MTKRRRRRDRAAAREASGRSRAAKSAVEMHDGGTALPSSVLGRFWERLSLASAALLALGTFGALFPMLQRLPVWDQWSMVEVFEARAAGNAVWPLLLKPYSGHLNVLPRIVFFVLGLWSSWNVRLEVMLSYVTVGLTLAIVLRMLADTRRELLWLAFPVAAQVLCLTQFENFLSGYPLGQLMSQLAATACVFVVTRPHVSPRSILAAAICALIATFSWGAGFVAWPLLCALLFLRVGPRQSVFFAAAATLLIAWAVRHGAGSRHIAWPSVGGFLFALLGTAAPPHSFPDLVEARWVGAVTLLVLLLLVGLGWRRIERLALLRWGGYGTLAVSSAAMIAVGRAGPGWETQALASHYATAAYPLIVAAVVLSGLLLLGRQGAPLSPPRMALLAALGLAICSHSLRNSFRTYQVLSSWQPYAAEVNRRLLSGTATDEEIRNATSPEPAQVRRDLEFLRQRRLTIFADGPVSKR